MNDLSSVIFGIVIAIFIFLICREIVCWYFKLNKINDTLVEIRDLLERKTESVKIEPLI